MSAAVPNLRQVISETKSLIKAHPRHYSALSIVFLFPISISTFIYLYIIHPTSTVNHSHYLQSLFLFSTPNPKKPSIHNDQLSPLLLQIIFAIFTSVFSICATASITYSTFNTYYNKPVRFISSVKSILYSFLPLLATLIVKQIIFMLIIFVFMILMLFTYNGLLYFNIEFDYDTTSFLVFITVITALLVIVLIYLQTEWYLSDAIVVIESKWGFSPLKMSSYLVKGNKRVVFSMLLLFGALGGLLSFLLLRLVAYGGRSFVFVGLQVIIYTGCLTALSLYVVVGNTVLFVYCKALHEEFCEEYVRLPNEDGDVSYVVNVV